MSNKVNMVKAAIKATSGKMFSVTFTKKNGELRTMIARTDVTSPLRGGENTVAHKPEYITVFDMQKKQYRHVNSLTVQSLTCGDMKAVFQ